MIRTAAFVLTLVAAMPALAYEEIYPRTPSGVVEVKVVPPAKAMQAEGQGTYFETDDRTFMKLFRYIDAHRVSMTVPVEADVEANRMRFFVGQDARERELPESEAVKIVTLPERRVVSVGLRGSYSREHFDGGLAQAREWLAQHPEWVAAGEPYAVYWNGPFVPGFMKRSEVHLPVAAATQEFAPERESPAVGAEN